MVKDYFDKIYLINLDRRTDRLKEAKRECRKVGIPFNRMPAVDGSLLSWDSECVFWNRNSYALLLTTIAIVRDAQIKGYDSILILEDDIVFDRDINSIFEDQVVNIPQDNWHMLFFGGIHAVPPKHYKGKVYQPFYHYCLHAYGIHKRIYDYYLKLLYRADKPIDEIVAEEIQPLDNTFCFDRSLVWQKEDFSNIQEQHVAEKKD